MTKVLNCKVVFVLTVSASLFLSFVQGGHHFASRTDRERRQGTPQSAPGVLYSAPSQVPQPFKPEVPALYSLPRSAESPRVLPSEDESSNEQLRGQGTTTEISSTPFEDSSQTPKKEEEVTMVTGGEEAVPTKVTEQEREPTPPGQERTAAENQIRQFGGYSSSPFYRMKVRGHEDEESVRGESGGHNNQPQKLNLIMENFIPHSFSNEIPRVYSVLHPMDQQQVENTFVSMMGQSDQQRQGGEEEGFRQLAAFRQPIRNDYGQRPQGMQKFVPLDQSQGGYGAGPSPQIHRHRIVEGNQYPMGIQNPAPTQPSPPQRSEGERSEDGMSLEGLQSHIVDSNLLDRVQQIIDDHERQQRDFLKRFQEEQEQGGQGTFPNGNPSGRMPNAVGGYAAAAPRSQEKLAGNGGDQQGSLSPANFFQQPQPVPQQRGTSEKLFRASKTFPENPNLEFQPAILTGHFEESGVERVDNMAEERQQNYPPPSQQNVQQPQQQKSLSQTLQQNAQYQPQQPQNVQSQPQQQSVQYQPQQQQQQNQQYQPQQQQNAQSQLQRQNVQYQPQQQQQQNQQYQPQQQQNSQSQPQQNVRYKPQHQQQQQQSLKYQPQYQPQQQNVQFQQQQQQQQQQQSVPYEPQQQQQTLQYQPQQQNAQYQPQQQIVQSQPQKQNVQYLPPQQQQDLQDHPQQQNIQYQSQQPQQNVQFQQQQQQQQNIQYQNRGAQAPASFPRPQAPAAQPQFYSSPLPMPTSDAFPQQSNSQPSRQSTSLPVELPYVHRSPPSSSSTQEGQPSLQPKPEEGFRPPFTIPERPSPPSQANQEEERENYNSFPQNPFLQQAQDEKDNTNSLEPIPESVPYSTRREQYLPPSIPYNSAQFQGENNLMNRVSPNVITRTIVVHEQPTGPGSQGLSNRVIVTGSDMMGFLSTHQQIMPVVSQGQEDGALNQPPQFQFLSASAQLTLGDQQRPPGAVSGGYGSGASQPNVPKVPIVSEEEVDKPRPIYGIPVAPVLGPESLDDSVVVDARPAQRSQQNEPQQGSSKDPNLFALYRLPKSQEVNPGGYAANQEMSNPTEQRRRAVNFQQLQEASELRSVQKRFSPAVSSPLAGYFSSVSSRRS